MPKKSQVRARVVDEVGVIELDNQPEQFMTTHMVRELDALTERWATDDAVRAIVITGAAPGIFITHFSVEELAQGGDAVPLSELPSVVQAAGELVFRGIGLTQRVLERLPALRKPLEHNLRVAPLPALLGIAQIHRVFSRLERMDKAVIVAINGNAMGGGCELALACDYRLMARGDFRIGLVEVLGGIIPGAGGTQRLGAAVGAAKAVEMLIDGTVVDADEAERIGLVTRAVDADKLLDEAMVLARRLTTRPLATVGHAKRAVRVGGRLSLDDGLTFERLAFLLAGTTAEASRRSAYYIKRFRAGARARQIFDELRDAAP